MVVPLEEGATEATQAAASRAGAASAEVMEGEKKVPGRWVGAGAATQMVEADRWVKGTVEELMEVA